MRTSWGCLGAALLLLCCSCSAASSGQSTIGATAPPPTRTSDQQARSSAPSDSDGSGTGAGSESTGDIGSAADQPSTRTSTTGGGDPRPAAMPTVVGPHLVDAGTGESWMPRGVNFPSFGYACAQGWGTSSSSAEGDAGADTAAAIASWNVNTVRLPLNQDCWNAANGVEADYAGDTYRAAVSSFVQQLNAAGLVVVLDLHSKKSDGPSASGQRAMADSESLTFFSSVAASFADNPSVMFDAFNEPYSRYDDARGEWALQLGWDCWRDGGCSAPVEDDYTETLSGQTYQVVGMAQLVSAIRAAGAPQPILLAGLDYANDLREWLSHRPEDDQLVASIHSYEGQRCADADCWAAEIGPVAAEVPVVIGEFGAQTGTAQGNVDYLESLMTWADENAVGYLIWAWWVLDDEPGPDAFALLSDDDGTPRYPVGTTFQDHLASR